MSAERSFEVFNLSRDDDEDSSSSFLFGGDPAGANLLASINLLSRDALRKEKKDEMIIEEPGTISLE